MSRSRTPRTIAVGIGDGAMIRRPSSDDQAALGYEGLEMGSHGAKEIAGQTRVTNVKHRLIIPVPEDWH